MPEILKILPPGRTLRFSGNSRVEFRIREKGDSSVHLLDAGESYSIVDMEGTGLGLFKNVAGRAGALDLAPFIPTSPSVVEEMLSVAGVDRDTRIYDLGCGDGRVVIAAARLYGARGIGVDIDPRQIREARDKARSEGVGRLVTFLEQDIFETDLSDANMVYIYMHWESNRLLEPYLENRLRKETIVVCLDFPLPRWKNRLYLTHRVPVEDFTHILYFYRWKPPKP